MVSSKAPSHHLHASLWEPHMQRSSVHLLCVSQRHSGWNQKSHLDSSDQRTDFHRFNVHCLCFLAQTSLFLLVSFSSGFFAAIQPWRPDSHSLFWIVDVEMCLLLNSVKHLFGLLFLRLVTLMNISSAAEVTLSSFPVAVLIRASCQVWWRRNNGLWLFFMVRARPLSSSEGKS